MVRWHHQLNGHEFDNKTCSLCLDLCICLLSAWKALLIDLPHPVKHHLPRETFVKDLLDAPLYWVLGLFLKQSIIRG